ncbi:hypothetical protein Y032_0031g2300 [Ancylostoma ceylanicum]|uniref:Uncharacterized protein n=1 Tax=Ancylostoma ceylanicum TaxID=53326 RepID=A0A016URL8_9BILA|nr:hypothetical protein Y032_0031g2300 [Ancylostoma ceylanicum]
MNPSPARGTDACNAPIPPNVIRAADVHAGNSTTAREKMKKVSKNTDQNKAAGMVFAQQTITTDWSKVMVLPIGRLQWRTLICLLCTVVVVVIANVEANHLVMF